jgi:biopolymer transport protein ExbD
MSGLFSFAIRALECLLVGLLTIVLVKHNIDKIDLPVSHAPIGCILYDEDFIIIAINHGQKLSIKIDSAVFNLPAYSLSTSLQNIILRLRQKNVRLRIILALDKNTPNKAVMQLFHTLEQLRIYKFNLLVDYRPQLYGNI